MFGKKKKLDVNEVAIKATLGGAGVGIGGFIFGFTSELGRSRAIKLIRRTDPNYAYPMINFNSGITNDDLPDEYAGGVDIDFDRALRQAHGYVDDIDDEDDEEDDDEIIEEPPKMKPKKK